MFRDAPTKTEDLPRRNNINTLYRTRHSKIRKNGTADRGYRRKPGHQLPRILRILLFQKSPGTFRPGCRYCLPFKKGCDYGTRGVRKNTPDSRTSRPSRTKRSQSSRQNPETSIASPSVAVAIPVCYPQFNDLIERLGATEAPPHIGYTSGKGWDDPAIADLLIENGLTEISFTVFEVDPTLRKNYMHDPTPGRLACDPRTALRLQSISMQQRCPPRVNDGNVLEHTCRWLEDHGAKGLILMRFANATEQGLILENVPS